MGVIGAPGIVKFPARLPAKKFVKFVASPKLWMYVFAFCQITPTPVASVVGNMSPLPGAVEPSNVIWTVALFSIRISANGPRTLEKPKIRPHAGKPVGSVTVDVEDQFPWVSQGGSHVTLSVDALPFPPPRPDDANKRLFVVSS